MAVEPMMITPTEAKALAKAAYIFAYPLVVSYGTMYRHAVDPSSVSYSGGFGRWWHHRTATTRETDLSDEHLTSVYSSAWLDLRAEPWIVEISAIDGSWLRSARITDLWGFVLDEVDSDPSGASIGLASPSWLGVLPETIDRVVRGDSSFVRCESWIGMRDPGDIATVRRVLRGNVVKPLSEHVDRQPPAAPPAIAWWPYQAGAETTLDFWPLVCFALSLTEPNEEDRAVLERLDLLAVGPTRRWDPEGVGPDVLEAIEEGMDDALTELMRDASRPGGGDGERRSRAEWDRNYFGRALDALRPWPTAVGSWSR